MLLSLPHRLCHIAADTPRGHLFYYGLNLTQRSIREYISYHAKILFRRWFQFLSNSGGVSGISFTTWILCKKTIETTFHNPQAGSLSKLFCSSEALFVFSLYEQTLCTAIIFPDGDEKYNIPALILLSVCTDEQSNSNKKSEKRVKLGNVIKKLNFSQVNVSDFNFILYLQLLFCYFIYKKNVWQHWVDSSILNINSGTLF